MLTAAPQRDRSAGRRRAVAARLPALPAIVAAVVVGVAAAERPVPTLVALTVTGLGLALVLSVDFAVLVFVAVEPFGAYLRSALASGIKLFGALLVVAWLLRLLTRERPVQLNHPAVRAAAALFALLLAATVVHQNGSAGAEVLTRYLLFLGAFLVLVDCLRDRVAPRRLVAVYVTSNTVAAVLGLVAFLHGSLRAGGPLGDPNDFAFFLVSALPLAIALRSRARRPWLFTLAALLLAGGIAASLSRGALTGAAAMIVFGLLAGILRPRIVLSWVLALAALVGVVAILSPAKISTSLTAKDSVAQQNVDTRLVLWRAAGQMIADNPVLGLGPAGFRQNHLRYTDYAPSDAVHPIDVAHEMYLEVGAELGLPALVAFVALIGFAFRGAQRARRRGRDPDLAAGVMAAIVGTSVAAAFLTEQYYLPVWLLAALGAALDPRQGAR